MNSTISPADSSAVGIFSSEKIGGAGYGIAISVGILLLITTIVLASYYCTRVNTTTTTSFPPRRPRWHINDMSASASVDHLEIGIDEETLMTYPKILYTGGGGEAAAAAAGCSICLADYKDRDELRKLPECGHAFHVKCVDPWLRMNPSCPLCRTSPLPTPLSTPLAEVVPLAARRD